MSLERAHEVRNANATSFLLALNTGGLSLLDTPMRCSLFDTFSAVLNIACREHRMACYSA
eukprot:6208696-Pleurochrysis_carterae.AAC.5